MTDVITYIVHCSCNVRLTKALNNHTDHLGDI